MDGGRRGRGSINYIQFLYFLFKQDESRDLIVLSPPAIIFHRHEISLFLMFHKRFSSF